MVENVKQIRPNLKRSVFHDFEILRQRRVQIPVTRAPDSAVPEIAGPDGVASSSQRHPGEGRCIQVDSRIGKIGIDGISTDVIGARVKSGLSDIHRLAAAGLENARYLPAAENVSSKAAAGRW